MNNTPFKKIVRIGTYKPTYRIRPVSIFCEIEYKEERAGMVLSISGVIGPNKWGNAVGGCGQIEMEFAHKNPAHNDSRYNLKDLIHASEINFADGWNIDKWWKFLEIWHNWHLNDLHAECEHQEKLGWTYNTHKGQNCPECGYRIGSAWTFREVPSDVIDFLKSLPDTDKSYPWA